MLFILILNLFLSKRAKILFYITKHAVRFFTLFFFFLYAYESYTKCDLSDFIIFGLIWSVQFGALAFIISINLLFHLAYFHILCYYLYLKLIKMNNSIAMWGKMRRDISI